MPRERVAETMGHRRLERYMAGNRMMQTDLVAAMLKQLHKVDRTSTLTLVQVNHIIRRQRQPTLAQAWAIERVTGIGVDSWLRPPRGVGRNG